MRHKDDLGVGAMAFGGLCLLAALLTSSGCGPGSANHEVWTYRGTATMPLRPFVMLVVHGEDLVGERCRVISLVAKDQSGKVLESEGAPDDTMLGKVFWIRVNALPGGVAVEAQGTIELNGVRYNLLARWASDNNGEDWHLKDCLIDGKPVHDASVSAEIR